MGIAIQRKKSSSRYLGNGQILSSTSPSSLSMLALTLSKFGETASGRRTARSRAGRRLERRLATRGRVSFPASFLGPSLGLPRGGPGRRARLPALVTTRNRERCAQRRCTRRGKGHARLAGRPCHQVPRLYWWWLGWNLVGRLGRGWPFVRRLQRILRRFAVRLANRLWRRFLRRLGNLGVQDHGIAP